MGDSSWLAGSSNSLTLATLSIIISAMLSSPPSAANIGNYAIPLNSMVMNVVGRMEASGTEAPLSRRIITDYLMLNDFLLLGESFIALFY